MPDLKISQLPVATTPLAGTELVPIVQGGVTDRTTVESFLRATVPSGTANGVLYLNGSKVATSGSALVFDGTNLGIGVTPSAWGSPTTGSLQVKYLSLSPNNAASDTSYITVNGYYNGTNWLYMTTAASSRYRLAGGAHIWDTAPSGTAGNAISFTQAMTLDASGRLLVGTASAATYGGNAVEIRGANIATLAVNASGNMSIFTTDAQAANVGAVLALGGTYFSTTPYVFGAIAGRKSNSTSGNAEGYLQFYTTDSSNAPVERMRLDSSGNLIQTAPTTPPTLSTNGTMVFNLTSNTNLRVSVRGSDGVTRVANLTLA